MCGVHNMQRREEKFRGRSLLKNLKSRRHFENKGIDGSECAI
jgi:hypothetical protein